MSRVSAQDRRELFVAAATKVIAEHGVAHATTRKIATEADAPLASLHYCYDTKDDLFAAVLKQPYGPFENLFTQIGEGEGLACGVEKIMRSMLEWVLAHTEFQGAQFEVMLWSLHRDRTLAETTLEEYFEINERALRRALAPGEDPALVGPLARVAAASIDGMVVHNLCSRDTDRIRADFEILVEGVVGYARRMTATV